MRSRRTIYHNDARHYYLWVFDPPMKIEDAWRPVDEVAGTAVDTFSYCVERGDGAFWPTRVGMLFGEDQRPHTAAIYWHAWECMQSLMSQGLDPLRVLIDRAHQKGMEFFADLRLATYGGMDPAHKMVEGGRGFAHPEVREHQLAVVEELATRYPVDGVELDFPAAFGGTSFYFRPEDVQAHTPVMTEWVRTASAMVRGRQGGPGQVGARVYPTEEMNLAQGLDVRTWLSEGLLDFVVPMLYAYMVLDPDMPIDWIVEAAHEADASVYGLLQPYSRDEATRTQDTVLPVRTYATPEMMRAASASYWDRGVDGLYTWFMKWPLGDTERRTLTEIGDPDMVKEANKQYVVRRRSQLAAELGYDASLPLRVRSAAPGVRYPIPFYMADDLQGAAARVRRVVLRINISNAVTADRLTVLLNGESLSGETCLRDFGRRDGPRDVLLEFHLSSVRPRRGRNLLEISLDSRPPGLEGGVTIEEVEVAIEYGPYPATLDTAPTE